MNRESLTSSCDSFVLTLLRPEPDAPDRLRGRIEISAGNVASVRVSVALVAHLTQRIGMSGIAGEATIVGASTSVARADGSVPFELAIPALARPYFGSHLRIEPALCATSDDGKRLRVVVPPEWLGPVDAVSILRDLPKTVPVARPAGFVIGCAVALIGAMLVALGASVLDVALLYQLGTGLVIAGGILALIRRQGALGWLRVGQASATLEVHERGLRVRVRAGPRAVGGRCALRATEYEIADGRDDELAAVLSRTEPFVRETDGSLSPSRRRRSPSARRVERWVCAGPP